MTAARALPVLLVGALIPAVADATPSEAAGLGGLDLHWPNGVDTFQYFESDLNLYVNPALAHRYRDQLQVNLGFAGGGAFEGAGQNPRGLLLAGTDTWTVGVALNRATSELGEDAALDATLDVLMVGNTVSGEVGGGVFSDPVSLAGLGAPSAAVRLQPPIDLFAAFALDPVTIGVNAYAAFGQERTDAETAVADPDDDWTRARALARSSWLTLRAGAAIETGGLVPEFWLAYTGVSAWSDAQAWGPAARGGWNDQDLVTDQTVGLRGTGRVGGGARATIPLDATMELVPVLQVDRAGGRTFAEYRLANDEEDPQESPIRQAEDDALRVATWYARVGTGVTWRPQEGLRVVGTVSAHLETTAFSFDNNAQLLGLPGTARFRTDADASTVVLPLVSMGAEYLFAPTFGVRAGLRSTTLLHRDRTANLLGVGLEADGFVLDQTGLSSAASEGGDLPPLTAAFGPSVRLDALTIDAVVGGGVLGAGMDLFSRVDAVFQW